MKIVCICARRYHRDMPVEDAGDLRILFVETFFGGSHRAFAEGFARHSAHRVDLVTLPADRWRERVRFGAFEIARRLPDPTGYDVILATDLINLGDLRAVWSMAPGRRERNEAEQRTCRFPPILLYLHETQSTYPPPRTERQRRERDPCAELQDVKNCLLAERVLFNSHSHRTAFLESLDRLVRDHPGLDTLTPVTTIRDRSGVVYPGVSLVAREAWSGLSRSVETRRPPRILWNHRREYDKRPRRFFRTLLDLATDGVPFEVVVLGEAPRGDTPEITRMRDELGERILHWGHVDSAEEYHRWLADADIIVSTAIQENFGIAVVEAIAAGCVPLLPRRLSYPELIPEELQETVLYDHDRDFPGRLRYILENLSDLQRSCIELPAAMDRLSWSVIAPELDRTIEAIVHRVSLKA